MIWKIVGPAMRPNICFQAGIPKTYRPLQIATDTTDTTDWTLKPTDSTTDSHRYYSLHPKTYRLTTDTTDCTLKPTDTTNWTLQRTDSLQTLQTAPLKPTDSLQTAPLYLKTHYRLHLKT